MRASSLSSQKVISLLNQFFVPVYVSNEDYALAGPAPAAEKAEKNRIYHESLKAQLSTGTVHVYILSPQGQPIDSQHVAVAAKPDQLLSMLERVIAKLELRPGPTVVKPVPQSFPPPCEPDSLTLHLTARVISGGAWGEYPAEDWIQLSRNEWHKLLPPAHAAVGTAWEIDAAVAAKLFNHFYPATENNDLAKNQIQQQSLRGTVLSRRNGVFSAQLAGKLRMKHPFYHKPDGNVVEATIVGTLDGRDGSDDVPTLRLITESAKYNHGTFAIAVDTVR